MISRLGPNIADVIRLFCYHQATHPHTRIDIESGLAMQEINIGGGRAVRRANAEPIALAHEQVTEFGAANADRIFQHGREYRLKIAGRTRDDAQDFSGRRLLRQGLAQFGEQPRILDGDHSLGGKIFDKVDLLVGKRPDFQTAIDEQPDAHIVLEHRHAQHGARTGLVGEGHDPRVALDIGWLSAHIGEVKGFLRLRIRTSG